jgi:hypothetical protein
MRATEYGPWCSHYEAKEEIDCLRVENEVLKQALQKVLDDSEIGVVPRSHLDLIERLLSGEGE